MEHNHTVKDLEQISRNIIIQLKELVNGPGDAIYVLMEAMCEMHLSYRHRTSVSVLETVTLFAKHLQERCLEAEKKVASKFINGDKNG